MAGDSAADDSVRRARLDALKPLPWPGRDDDRARRREVLAGGVTRYYCGSFYVDVATDGRIVVSRDDWLSKYALAIDGTLDVRGKFLRNTNGQAVAIENEDLIRTGEILIHRHTAENQQLTEQFGAQFRMQFPLRPSDPDKRIDQLLARLNQMQFGPPGRRSVLPHADDGAAKMLIDYAKSRLEDVDRIGEEKKQEYFLTSSSATMAILLYEFATGEGPQYRRFDMRHMLVLSLMSSRINDEILRIFALENQYETDPEKLNRHEKPGEENFRSYQHSPDQTGSMLEAFGKFMYAQENMGLGNDIYLYFGGVSYKVKVDAPNQMLHILLRDRKSKNTLMARVGQDLDRVGLEKTPLGTIEHDYEYTVPIPWERIHELE